MPIILAQTIDALNKTLEELDNLAQVENIPGSILVMGVLMSASIMAVIFVFWRVMSAQLKSSERYLDGLQKSADTAQSNYIVERDHNNEQIESLVTQTQGIAQTQVALTEQMTQTAQYLSKTAEALKALELRVIEGEAQTLDYWEKVELVGKELKENVDELKNGNGEILTELRDIKSELKRIAHAIEITLDKLSKESAASHDKPKPDTPEDSA